jgi:hypothetical protein
VSITIKKEESPIVVPLHISADEEIKREERSPLPSLRYPSTSSRSGPSSRLSSYRTRSPALCFSPVRRGDSLDSTYHPATPIRSPTPLEQPIDWKQVRQHGAVTDTTIVPSTTSSRTRLNPINHALRRIFLPSEVSDLIREGLQLGAQQRAEEERLAAIWQRVLEARGESKRDLIVKREFHPAILLFLTLCLAVGLGVPLLVLFYVTASLLFGLESYLGYLHASAKISFVTSRIVPTLRRVPRFEAPIHVPRPRNPSPIPPPPYVRGPRVILEEETDESVSDSN